MCTAISHGSYAGRNLDVDKDYNEEIIITPREYIFNFKRASSISSHYAMIGMGVMADGYPLYFDAANERGLYAAGLNYLGNAKYQSLADRKAVLAPYELIPYLLSKCATVKEAEYELEGISLTDIPFRADMPVAELHFFIADKGSSIVVEPDADGLKVYKNPVGVLTNEPPFPYHLAELGKYSHLTPKQPSNSIFPEITRQSLGLGAFGLAGDYSSASRFSKAAFLASVCNLPDTADEQHKVAHFFRLLYSVAPPYGAVLAYDGKPHYSLYSCCMNATSAIYYVCAYDSLSVSAKTMSESDMNGKDLISYFH